MWMEKFREELKFLALEKGESISIIYRGGAKEISVSGLFIGVTNDYPCRVEYLDPEAKVGSKRKSVSYRNIVSIKRLKADKVLDEIDHRYTDQLICPYCGYEFTESWELGEDGEVDCDCGKRFSFYSETRVNYWSDRDCSLNKEEHDWKFEREVSEGNMEKCSRCDQIRFIRPIEPMKDNKQPTLHL